MDSTHPPRLGHPRAPIQHGPDGQGICGEVLPDEVIWRNFTLCGGRVDASFTDMRFSVSAANVAVLLFAGLLGSSVVLAKETTNAPSARKPPVPKRQGNLVYPQRAQLRRLEGTVTVDFVISKFGTTTNITIAKSSGSGLLDASALYAVSTWSYLAARVDGKRVDWPCRQDITFKAPKPEKIQAMDAKKRDKALKTSAPPATGPPAFYPRDALIARQGGEVELWVKWLPDGTVDDVQFAKSSGRFDLDLMSAATVYCDWKLPPETTTSNLTTLVPFIYKVAN
jgi:TonB family protein